MATTTTTSTVKETGLPSGVLDTLKGEMGGVYDKLKQMGIPEVKLAGMTEDQKKALKKLSESGQLNKFAEAGGAQLLQATGALGKGTDVLEQAAAGKMQLTPEKMAEFATQLQDKEGLESRIGAMSGDVQRTLSESALPSIYRGAAGSGNVGSSRSALAEGVARRGASDAVAKNAALMRAQSQQNAMDRAQTILGGNLQTQLGSAKGLAGIGSTAISQMSDVGKLGQQATMNQLQAGGMQQEQQQQQLNTDRQNELMKRMKESGITDAQQMINLLSGLRGVTDTGASVSTSSTSGPSTSDILKESLIPTALGVGAKWLGKKYNF